MSKCQAPSPISDNGFEKLKKKIKEMINFDPGAYKEKPLKRRLRVRMRATEIDTFSEYARYLESNAEEQKKLADALTINVSKFFRNRDTFETLGKDVIKIFTDTLNIWSAGCASGEEAYTLAIIGMEYGKPGLSISVYGTDIDEMSLNRAKEAVYSAQALTETPQIYIDRYFDKLNGNLYRVKDKVRKSVHFMKINLSYIPESFQNFDIIVCRNVFIYLSKEFQEKVIKGFYNSLNEGGYLVLGKVETMFGDIKNLFYTFNTKERIYRKV